MAEEGLNQKMNPTECETYTVMKAQHTISLIVLSSLALSSVLTANAAKPPNIILIMADDFGWDISALGQTAYQTPERDKLIKGGMQFSDFHSNGACCTPTRAALLTGKYQQRTGMVRPMNSEFHGHAIMGEVVGMAASICGNRNTTPRGVYENILTS
jgi:hypothetical protein